MSEKRIYYSHSREEYWTCKEKWVLQRIGKIVGREAVVNPAWRYSTEMSDYIELLKTCDAMIFTEFDHSKVFKNDIHSISLGVFHEIEFAQKNCIPCYYMRGYTKDLLLCRCFSITRREREMLGGRQRLRQHSFLNPGSFDVEKVEYVDVRIKEPEITHYCSEAYYMTGDEDIYQDLFECGDYKEAKL